MCAMKDMPTFTVPAYYCKELSSDKIGCNGIKLSFCTSDGGFLKDWLVRICELIDKYKPKVVYFDWWIHNRAFKPYLKKFAAYYYNRAAEWGTEVTINYKLQAFAPGSATFDVERGSFDRYFARTVADLHFNSKKFMGIYRK